MTWSPSIDALHHWTHIRCGRIFTRLHKGVVYMFPEFAVRLFLVWFSGQVYPTVFRELPPPALDLFDLDEEFSSEKVRLAQLSNDCEWFNSCSLSKLPTSCWKGSIPSNRLLGIPNTMGTSLFILIIRLHYLAQDFVQVQIAEQQSTVIMLLLHQASLCHSGLRWHHTMTHLNNLLCGHTCSVTL